MKRISLALLILSFVLSLSALPQAGTQAQSVKVLRMALPEGDTNNLDPHQYQTLGEFQVLVNVVEGLVTYDPKSLQPIPALAEKWDITPDGLKYTFHLRSGVKFSNGREMTADDVKYSFTRLANPKVATTYATSLILGSVTGFNDVNAGKATDLTGVKVIDPHTVEIDLDSPNSALLSALTMIPAGVVPKEAVEDTTKPFTEHPIGTGPFIVQDWQRQQQITLVANPNYWGGKPAVDQVILKVIPEKSSQMVEFAANNLDLVIVNPADVARIKADPTLTGRVQDQAILSIFWLALNLNRPPLDNVKVRQALAFAVDRDSLVKSILQGQGVASNGPIPPGLSAYDPNYKPYTYNIDKAKQLLTDAGFPNGVDVEIRTWNDEVEGRVLTAIQSMWAKAGIRATFNRTEYTAYINDLSVCNMQIGTSSWTADYADPDDFINPLPLSDLSTQGDKCGLGKVPDVKNDALKALTLPLGTERDALYQKAQQIAQDNVLGIFLYHRGATLAYAANVTGAYLDGLNAIKLYPIALK